MKKFNSKFFLVCILISLSTIAEAGCDMCSLYLGIHPNQTKNNINLRYRFSLYESNRQHTHNGVSHSDATTTEWRTFQTIEVWAQWRIGRKMQLLAVIPYSMNSIENKGLVLDSYNSIGDAQALLRYQIFRSSSEDELFSQRIIIGIGLKAPTGQFNLKSNAGNLDPHIQTGTGSWDFIYNIGYLLKYKSYGINEELIYKLNTTNKNEYKFADRISSSTNLFYIYEHHNINLIPSIGFLIEHAQEDKDQGISQNTTNGTSYYINPGLDMYYKNWNWSINFQKPIIENLRDPHMSNKYRWIIGSSFAF